MADISKIQIKNGVYNIKDAIARQLLEIKPYYFNNVASMKLGNLVDGDMAITEGYYSPNDGGNAIYKIREKTISDVIDEMFIVEINTLLVAELIITNEINVNACGVYGDNIHDDYITLNSLCNKARDKKLKLCFNSSSTYLISQPLEVSNLFINFNNCTIKVYGNNNINNVINVNSMLYYTHIENLNIDCTHASVGIDLIQARKCYITNVNINNINNIGIRLTGGYEVKINHINLNGDGLSHCYGMYNYGHDATITDVVIIDCTTAIYNRGFNIYNDIHAWILTPALMYHSIFLKIEHSQIMATNIYADTYHWVICSEPDLAECVITNLFLTTNEDIATTQILQNEPISLHHGNMVGYTARFINIKNSIILAPNNIGLNWNTDSNNDTVDFAGVLDARFPSLIAKYLQGIPNSPALTLPNTLQKTNEFVNIKMDSVDLNCFYKILTVASTYRLKLPFYVPECRLPVYECTEWDSSIPVGLAYLLDNDCTIAISGDATIHQNRFLYIGGSIPRIYRTNS